MKIRETLSALVLISLFLWAIVTYDWLMLGVIVATFASTSLLGAQKKRSDVGVGVGTSGIAHGDQDYLDRWTVDEGSGGCEGSDNGGGGGSYDSGGGYDSGGSDSGGSSCD